MNKTRWWQLKYFWNFHPENWGKFPFWRIFFRWVVQPPTRKAEVRISRIFASLHAACLLRLSFNHWLAAWRNPDVLYIIYVRTLRHTCRYLSIWIKTHKASIYSYFEYFCVFFRVMVTTCSSIIVWMFKMRFQFFVYEHVIVIVGWKALRHLWWWQDMRLFAPRD